MSMTWGLSVSLSPIRIRKYGHHQVIHIDVSVIHQVIFGRSLALSYCYLGVNKVSPVSPHKWNGQYQVLTPYSMFNENLLLRDKLLFNITIPLLL